MCDKMGNMHYSMYTTNESDGSGQEKHLYHFSCSWTSWFLWKAIFIWEIEWQTTVFRHEYLANIFLGDEQVNQSLKKNNWECLLPTIKFNLSSKSQNFVKLVCATMNLTDSQYLTKLSDETGSVINVFYILLILYNKMCQPLEVLCNSVHQIFQIANAGCYEIMHEWKSQSSRQIYTFSNRLQNVHW